MKFKISYFARIRKFAQHEVPVSTAMWDPKWFHPMRKPKGIYTDKRGVINGLRVDPFVPGYGGCDGPRDCLWEPEKCNFMDRYRQQLSKLDAAEILQRFRDLEARLQEKYPGQFPDGVTFVLMVYEKPDNECSERVPIMDWFHENAIAIEEWKEDA